MTASLCTSRFLAIVRLVVRSRQFQPLTYQLYVALGCLDALGRFLLKRMEDIDDFSKAHRVDRPVSVAVEVVHDLKYPGPLAFPGFSRWMLAAELSDAQSVPHFGNHRIWKVQEIALGGADPSDGLLAPDQFTCHIYPQIGIISSDEEPDNDCGLEAIALHLMPLNVHVTHSASFLERRLVLKRTWA